MSQKVLWSCRVCHTKFMPREDTNGFVRCYACEEKHQQSKYSCNKCLINFSTKRERTEHINQYHRL